MYIISAEYLKKLWVYLRGVGGIIDVHPLKERTMGLDLKPYSRRANYYETDQMGIIHHANYIHWFEEARVDFMDRLGFGYIKCVEAGIDIALLDVYCEYKSMVRFGDVVNISVFVTELKSVRMTVDYRVEDAVTGELLTVGKTRHFFYSSNKKRPVSLKKALPELYDIFNSLLQPETADN